MRSSRERYELLRREFNAAAARGLATSIWQSDRMMSNRHFAQTADYCACALREAGLAAVRVERFPADGRTAFGDLVMPKAWECASAELIVSGQGDDERFCSYPEEPLSIAMGCGRTAKRGVEGELIHVEGGTQPSDFKGADCRGKFVLTEASADKAAPEAAKRGALGVISYAMPTFAPARPQAWDNADGRLWQRIDPEKGWLAFVLTPRQGEELRRRVRAATASGPVCACAKVQSRAYDGQLPTVTAVVPGRSRKEIVIIAHLFEPGANDNASGCACAIELARTITRLIARKLIPQLTLGIRILLPMEFNTTLAFFAGHPQIRRNTVAGIVPDMVGEDQALCGSALQCQTTPDAAPSFINCLMQDALDAVRDGFARSPGPGREPYWLAVERGYWGNDCFVSDPTIGIPTVGLIEWPDRFYHSSADTPEKLSETTLTRSGALVGAIALAAATLDEGGARALCYRMTARAIGDLERAALAFLDERDKDQGEAEEPVEVRLNGRLQHLVLREKAALESVLALVPARGKGLRRLRGLIDSLGEDLDDAAERLRERRRRACGPASGEPRRRLSKAERRAHDLVPRRTTMGPVRFRKLDAGGRRRLDRIQKKGLPGNLLLWVDGRRTVAEIVARCKGEGAAADIRNVLAYLDLLVESGYAEWVT